MPYNVTSLAENVVARVTGCGKSISWPKARNAALALIYLLERDVRMPTTREQARALDSEARRQCRAFCAAWKEWSDAASKTRCEGIIEMLMSVEQEVMKLTARRAPEPICGWADQQPRGVYTKAQWHQSA